MKILFSFIVSDAVKKFLSNIPIYKFINFYFN